MTKPTGKPRGRPKKTAQDRATEAAAAPAGEDAPKAPTRTSGPKNGVGLVVSDATILDFWDKALAAKQEADRKKADFDSANGAFRAILKAADKSGVPKAALLWRLSKRNEDVEEIDRHTAWCNRLAKLTNLPIGTQLGLFEGGGSVAAEIERKLIVSRETGAAPISPAAAINGAYTTEQLVQYSWDGEEAAKAGKARNTNPHEFATPPFDRWNIGWDDEHKRLVQIGQWNPAPPEEAVAVTGEA